MGTGPLRDSATRHHTLDIGPRLETLGVSAPSHVDSWGFQVPLEGFEPSPSRSVVGRSDPLSYRGVSVSPSPRANAQRLGMASSIRPRLHKATPAGPPRDSPPLTGGDRSGGGDPQAQEHTPRGSRHSPVTQERTAGFEPTTSALATRRPSSGTWCAQTSNVLYLRCFVRPRVQARYR